MKVKLASVNVCMSGSDNGMEVVGSNKEIRCWCAGIGFCVLANWRGSFRRDGREICISLNKHVSWPYWGSGVEFVSDKKLQRVISAIHMKVVQVIVVLRWSRASPLNSWDEASACIASIRKHGGVNWQDGLMKEISERTSFKKLSPVSGILISDQIQWISTPIRFSEDDSTNGGHLYLL